MNYVKSCLIITMLVGIGYTQCDANGDGHLDVLDIVVEVDCILIDCWEEPPCFVVVDGEPVAGAADADGNCYETIQIGEQLWLKENLKTTHYNNGDEIPYPSNEDWGSLVEGQYGVYDNDPSHMDHLGHGNLYNFAVTQDERGVCPEGFHVPSYEEYTILTDYLSQDGWDYCDYYDDCYTAAGAKMKEAGNAHWEYFSDDFTAATNESGFTALPAGLRTGGGIYWDMGYRAHLWTATPEYDYCSIELVLYYDTAYVSVNCKDNIDGLSIRYLGD